MVRTVSSISGLVLVYRDLYMEGDKYLNRFVLIVIMFVYDFALVSIKVFLFAFLNRNSLLKLEYRASKIV